MKKDCKKQKNKDMAEIAEWFLANAKTRIRCERCGCERPVEPVFTRMFEAAGTIMKKLSTLPFLEDGHLMFDESDTIRSLFKIAKRANRPAASVKKSGGRGQRWVTGYYTILGGVSNVTVHKDKATAEKYFKANYRSYFQINTPFKVKLPCTYGFPHRKVFAMSIRAFEKEFGKVSKLHPTRRSGE